MLATAGLQDLDAWSVPEPLAIFQMLVFGCASVLLKDALALVGALRLAERERWLHLELNSHLRQERRGETLGMLDMLLI